MENSTKNAGEMLGKVSNSLVFLLFVCLLGVVRGGVVELH
jgi:hypothetical protein